MSPLELHNQHSLKDTSCMHFETKNYLNVRDVGNLSTFRFIRSCFVCSVASIEIDVFMAYSRCYVPLQLKLIALQFAT